MNDWKNSDLFTLFVDGVMLLALLAAMIYKPRGAWAMLQQRWNQPALLEE